jgi:glycogen debranching enzyme
MAEIIHINDQFYIQTTSELIDYRTKVIKHGETFALFDRYGDIHPLGKGEQGLYHEGTRFLSRLSFRLGGMRPLFLSSTVTQDNVLVSIDLTNPDMSKGGDVIIPRGTLHIFRSKFLWKEVCHERLRISNYGLFPVEVSLLLEFDADYADIFEVRGLTRKHRGRRLNEVILQNGVLLAYQGLDEMIRTTRLECSPTPTGVSGSELRFEERIEPKGSANIYLTISCECHSANSHPVPYDRALADSKSAMQSALSRDCQIYTSSERFNDWLNRSQSDLHMLVSYFRTGPYPYAGVPWFSTVFGRDGLITAFQYLWVNSEVARGVLAYLASTQAREIIYEQDAEPGKILHETRQGEMAALKEIPFGRYYGSVDATPLFIFLAGAYYERTGDLSFIETIWPNIELALHWIDNYGDADGDGFVEYLRHSPKGLTQQGWKDSYDSVFHADGALANGPIALCEVQGYVYAAKLWAGQLANALGRAERAQQLRQQAEDLQRRFEQTFWDEELSTYVLALDGAKRPCRVRSSNAGHALFTQIASPNHARRVAQTLLAESSFSGWGIRTLDAAEVRYNPISYHNGSVWPHDNALIAYGLASYGLKEWVIKILAGLFDSSLFVDLNRLPELFCGFHRRPSEGPTLYPVACTPQAWAAAAVFMLLQALLGLFIKSLHKPQVYFSQPLLPEFLERVRITGLTVGNSVVDLLLTRQGEEVRIDPLRNPENVEIILSRA